MLTDTLLALFSTLGDLLKQLHGEARYVLASFLVAVCHNTRIPRCKLLTGKTYRGHYANKRSWFHGLKVQVVATSDGLLVNFYLHAGAESEQTGQRCLPLDLPEGSVLYSDASYTYYVAEDIFHEASSKRPITRRKPFCPNIFVKVSKRV